MSWKQMKALVARCTLAVSMVCLLAAAGWVDREKTWQFSIPRQNVDAALTTLAQRTGTQLLFPYEQVKAQEANPLYGSYTLAQALEILLRGTELVGDVTASGVITISLATSARDRDRGDEMGSEKKNGILAGIAAVLFGAGAAAQDNRDVAGSDPELRIDQIVVTARRREEAISDVPVSIQVLTGRDLARLGAVNFSDYARTVAGVQFEDKGAGRWTISMRGVSTGSDVDTGKESTVGVYFDETPTAESSSQPDLKLYDIDRIEVLRGPQGTLFGSGSLSGALRILPRQPNPSEIEGSLQGQLSSTEHGGLNYLVNGMVNLPLSDTAAIRVVGYHIDNEGFLTNGFTGVDKVNDESTSGGRIALLLQPTDRLEMTLSGVFQESHFGTYYQVTDHFPDLVIDEAAPEPFDDRHFMGSLKVNYDFDEMTLTSVTSYYDRERYFENDINFFTAFFGVPEAFSPLTYTAETLTQEFRLASQDDRRFEWVLGAFFQDRSEEALQTASAAGEPVPASGDQLFFVNRFTDTRQYAVFGEGEFEITPTVAFTTGLRVSRIDGDKTSVNDGLLFGGNTVLSASSKDTPITPRFILSYKPDENLRFYAQAAKGFRIGGSNPGLPPCSVSPGCIVDVGETFGPDTTWNYEIGSKVQMFDQALSLDADIFYIDWSDIQTNVGRGDGTNGFLNAGKAVSRGAELSVNASLGDQLQVGGQFTYTRGKLTSLAPGVEEQGVAQVGDRLPQVPRMSTSGYAELGTAVGVDGWMYLRGDVQYVGTRYSNFSSRDPRTLEAYTLANLRVGIDTGPYSAALFVNNLTDKRANLSDTFYEGLHNGEPYSWMRRNVNVPRTIGVVFSRDF